MTDSSQLLSTEAPTLPSVTLSNWEPFTRLHYAGEQGPLLALDADWSAATGTWFYRGTSGGALPEYAGEVWLSINGDGTASMEAGTYTIASLLFGSLPVPMRSCRSRSRRLMALYPSRWR